MPERFAQGNGPVKVLRAYRWDQKVRLVLSFPTGTRREIERAAWTAMARGDIERVAVTREGGL